MPATSLSADRLWRRSDRGRPGSPSKSMKTTSLPVHRTWPAWKSPWVRMRPQSTRVRVSSVKPSPGRRPPAPAPARPGGWPRVVSVSRTLAKQPERARGLVAHRLEYRALVQRAERLPRERGIVRQSTTTRRGAAPSACPAAGDIEVLPDGLRGELGDSSPALASRIALTLGAAPSGGGGSRRGDLLEERAHRVERVLPHVALVGHVLLEDAERRRFVARGPIGEPAADLGRVFEATVGQGNADLQLRVNARLEAPEQLQDHPIPEDDGRIALLRVAHPRREIARYAAPRSVRYALVGVAVTSLRRPGKRFLAPTASSSDSRNVGRTARRRASMPTFRAVRCHMGYGRRRTSTTCADRPCDTGRPRRRALDAVRRAV